MTDVTRLKDKVDAIGKYAHADMALYASVMPGQPMDSVGPLIEGGVVAFEISGFESSPTRFPRIPAGTMLELFEALAQPISPSVVHNQDQDIVLAVATARAPADGGI